MMKSLIAWEPPADNGPTAVATLAGTAAALATHQMTTRQTRCRWIVGSLLGNGDAG